MKVGTETDYNFVLKGDDMILTGDLHASSEELQFLKPEYLREKYGSKCENTIIAILGDGGFLWHEDPYSDFGGELISTLNNWLKELNSVLIVVPGNHENYKRIYSLPKVHLKEKNFEGDFREISPRIKYTERYGEYIIENKYFLVLGGARSLDKMYRHTGEWFSEETFSIEEKDKIVSFIKDNEYDYVLSHTCPDHILHQIYETNFRDSNSEFFDKVMNYISPKTWFFGHLHPEKIQGEWNDGNFDNLRINDTKFKCLFKSIQDMI